MNKLESSLHELLNMHNTAEPTIKKDMDTIVLVMSSKEKRKPRLDLRSPRKSQPSLRMALKRTNLSAHASTVTKIGLEEKLQGIS